MSSRDDVYSLPGGGELRRADIEEVAIETTDQGPLVEDVFFVIVTKAETLRLEQGMPGSEQLLAWLQALPGFNNQAVIDAMMCTDVARFACFKRAR